MKDFSLLFSSSTGISSVSCLSTASYKASHIYCGTQLFRKHARKRLHTQPSMASFQSISTALQKRLSGGKVPRSWLTRMGDIVLTETVMDMEEKPAVTAATVKQLRDETGAGMMDCKRALTETGNDFDKARDYLRKKGLASAEKKSNRITAEGRIASYIHDNRIGVLIEVNCETDFVARGEIFQQLVDDLAMQVVACPSVQYVSVEDILEETVNKEREIEMQREDVQRKPEVIRSRIVEGRLSKRLNELALLEQPYIKDDNILIKDLVKQMVATVGENIRVRRFEKYVLGQGLEKKIQKFSAGVAAHIK